MRRCWGTPAIQIGALSIINSLLLRHMDFCDSDTEDDGGRSFPRKSTPCHRLVSAKCTKLSSWTRGSIDYEQWKACPFISPIYSTDSISFRRRTFKQCGARGIAMEESRFSEVRTMCQLETTPTNVTVSPQLSLSNIHHIHRICFVPHWRHLV